MLDQQILRGHGRAAAGLFAAALATLVALTAGSAQAATVTVAAMNYEFKPATRTIAVGDVVRWTFAGDPHSVTSRDGLFDSGVTDPGGSFQFRFTTAGTYRYFCQVHPEQMFGTIVVKAPSATPRPTVRSTAKPTPRPTAKPTSTPEPTPTPTQATAVSSSPSPGPSVPVAPSPSADASVALVETPGPSSGAASPAPGATTPTSATDAAPIVVVGVLLAAIAAGGLLIARRRPTN